jgi:hypothetical protein
VADPSDKTTPEALKALRKNYHSTLTRHNLEYSRTFSTLADRYEQALNSLQTELTKANRLDEGLRVKAVRDEIREGPGGRRRELFGFAWETTTA